MQDDYLAKHPEYGPNYGLYDKPYGTSDGYGYGEGGYGGYSKHGSPPTIRVVIIDFSTETTNLEAFFHGAKINRGLPPGSIVGGVSGAGNAPSIQVLPS
jgi:hypothetical protein